MISHRIACSILLSVVVLASGCGNRNQGVVYEQLVTPPDPSIRPNPAELAAFRANAALSQNLDVQIQPVRDRQTLDAIRSTQRAAGLAPDGKPAKSGDDEKPMDSAFHFLAVARNTRSTTLPAGTSVMVTVRRKGDIILAGSITMRAMAPGEIHSQAYSVDCPTAGEPLSIEVKAGNDSAAPSAHTATLEVHSCR